jgi:importin-5
VVAGPEFLEGMWIYICPELLKAIDTEPENDVLSELMFSLSKVKNLLGITRLQADSDLFFQCIETLGNGCLTEPMMAELVRILDKLLKEHFTHAEDRQEKRADEDYDEVNSLVF